MHHFQINIRLYEEIVSSCLSQFPSTSEYFRGLAASLTTEELNSLYHKPVGRPIFYVSGLRSIKCGDLHDHSGRRKK